MVMIGINDKNFDNLW